MWATSLRELARRRLVNRFPFRINRRRFGWSRKLRMNPALELVGAGPAAGPLLLVGARRPRAWNAADRAVADAVQRVVWDLVHGDVRPHSLLVPVGEWM